MANMNKNTITGSWELTQTVDSAGDKAVTIATENTFVDGDIEVTISTPAGALGTGTETVQASSDIPLLGTASSTQPSSGHYVKVEGNASVSVGTSGWIDAGESASFNKSDVYYPIDNATFANTGTSGETYTDISNSPLSPVLVSGDYLYINKGWADNQKISLSKLVPDGSDVKGHNEYILSGHSAYDDDGDLVAGSIPTYNGSYTVS